MTMQYIEAKIEAFEKRQERLEQLLLLIADHLDTGQNDVLVRLYAQEGIEVELPPAGYVAPWRRE